MNGYTQLMHSISVSVRFIIASIHVHYYFYEDYHLYTNKNGNERVKFYLILKFRDLVRDI